MVVDSHLHIWRALPHYPGPSPTIISPTQAVPMELLEQYLQEYAVDRAVLVQPIYPGEDNTSVADCAIADPERFAAVCVADPRQPEAPERLAYWVRERGCRGLRLRPRLPGEAEVFGSSAIYPLWEQARSLGIVINILMGPEHLPALAALVERFPEVPVVIDHLRIGNSNPQPPANDKRWARTCKVPLCANLHRAIA